MELLEILSAEATQVPGLVSMELRVDFGDGPETMPFAYGEEDLAPLSVLVRDWLAENPDFEIGEAVPVVPILPPLTLQQIAAARLAIDGFDITGIERSQGIGAAMMIDEGLAWIFFEDPQSDTSYIVTPADGVTKYPDYIEVSCAGATSLALIVQRVQ